MAVKIYLDMCSLQRPLDTKTQVWVAVEAEPIPLSERRMYILEVLARAEVFIPRSQFVEEKATAFVDLGIKPLAALHLSSAIDAQADYFCICDDRFLRRAKTAITHPARVVSPLELVTEIIL